MDGVDVTPAGSPSPEELRRGRVVVRFAGDSGDGIQLLGGEFAKSVAASEHDILTFADFPAEIRAPVGTLFGVSAFQIQFGGPRIFTTGDRIDVLFAFNPAALKTNLERVRDGGLVVLDGEVFTERNLRKAAYAEDPRETGELGRYRVIDVPITRLAREVASSCGVSKKEADRSKNFWALGLAYWMFGQDRTATQQWIREKFAASETIAEANVSAFDAGHAYGETIELDHHELPEAYNAEFPAGRYRSATGTETLVYGLAAATIATGRPLCFCSYPITPASAILHGLARFNTSSIRTFQAEDEIAAVCAAIGASYGGAIGVTASSGPGIALKGEAIGLAVGAELPLVVIDVQRAGPSTGMPTKTEQADLELALYGRHGEASAIVLAPANPAECFDAALEAVRLATALMVPVILLMDGYIANASEPWQLPDLDQLPRIERSPPSVGDGPFQPFLRDPETLSRPWASPGMAGLEHRIGGIERSDGSGHISYDPDNHQRMTDLRAEKVSRASRLVPRASIELGEATGDVALVAWGSTHGPVAAAVNELRKEGHAVSHVHLRNLSPLPDGLEDLLKGFRHVLVVEMNKGQLRRLIRSEFLLPAHGLNQVTGRPFTVAKVKRAVHELLDH